MRKLFRSIFYPKLRNSGGNLPDSLVNAVIDRTVDRTDKRRRALTGYRKRLWEPVTKAVRHIIRIVGRPPAGTDLIPSNFGHEPTLGAVFVSSDHLRDTSGRLQTIRHYLDTFPSPRPAEIFGLMTMSQHRHRVLGLELNGETVVREFFRRLSASRTTVSSPPRRADAP